MKTILAPTDFSAPALNAIYYGAEVCRRMGAKLVLLNAYHIPVVASEIPIVIPGDDEMEKDGLENLNNIMLELERVFGANLKVELVCVSGYPEDAIRDYCQKNDVAYVVMGMEGTGFIEERFIGSTTTSLLRNSRTPILSIAQSVKFRDIKRIVLTEDYEGFENPELLNPMKDLARLFNSHIYVLYVRQEDDAISEQVKNSIREKLDELLHGFQHSYHSEPNKHIVEGINAFVLEKNANMIVMIPKKNAIQSLFFRSESKRMAFHTDVPLLTIHE